MRLPALPIALLAAALCLAGCAGNPSQPSHSPTPPRVGEGPCAAQDDPSSLVCRISGAEATLRDPATTPEGLADAGRRAQDAYRLLGEHPEWDAPVRAGLDPALRQHVDRAVAAQRDLTSLAGPPEPTLPAWRIVEPPPAERLRELYQAAQRRFGVPWTVLAAINLVETRMGRVVGLSTAGAQGPMQFMPATWAGYGLGGDVWDTEDAINGAANYLARNGAADPARLDQAIKRYNNDVRYVRAVRAYAAMMDADPRVFVGLHSWPVKYRTSAGDIALPVGYQETRVIPVEEWLARNPGATAPAR